ncbi:6-carboxytetrahydropterin synthase QueD [bacterium]|nr:6-carboxytetrahydropterin synthase QueD [bacterium]
MFRVFIDTHFAAAHQLHGYDGECRALHGHTWKVRVEIETEHQDEIGISFDFKTLKAHVNSIIEKLDHHNVNEVPPFDKINPTAENLAKYIYNEIARVLPDYAKLSQTVVWESDHYAVSYFEK